MNDLRLRPEVSRGGGLSPPLRRFLRPSVDESSVQKMWRVIAARSAPDVAMGHGRPWLPSWAALAVAAFAVLGLLVLGFVVLERPSPPPPAGVLLTREGRPFESLEAAVEDATQAVTLADGSRIEVSPGARVERLASTPTELVLLLRRGQARFFVTPGGPRRWLIETPAARVEVVGTILSVDAGEGAVRVHVEEGVVLVRSPWLPDGVRRLEAGHSLELRPPEPLPAQIAAPTPAEPAAGSVAKPPASSAIGAVRRAGAAKPAGEAHDGASAARLLWADADRARRAGQPRAAALLLEQLIREHPEDPQAALGAFTLGALYADELDRPQLAAQAFQRAVALGIPSLLRDACYVRWAEAARAAGDVAGARRAVEEYAQKYPAGEQLPALRALLGEAIGPR